MVNFRRGVTLAFSRDSSTSDSSGVDVASWLALKDGRGGAATARAGGNADRGAVSVLVHRQLGRQRDQ